MLDVEDRESDQEVTRQARVTSRCVLCSEGLIDEGLMCDGLGGKHAEGRAVHSPMRSRGGRPAMGSPWRSGSIDSKGSRRRGFERFGSVEWIGGCRAVALGHGMHLAAELAEAEADTVDDCRGQQVLHMWMWRWERRTSENVLLVLRVHHAKGLAFRISVIDFVDGSRFRKIVVRVEYGFHHADGGNVSHLAAGEIFADELVDGCVTTHLEGTFVNELLGA